MRYVTLLAGLWCAVRASDIAVEPGKPFVLYMVVKNDSGKNVDVTKVNLPLLVDGKPMAGFHDILVKGANPVWHAIPSGKHLPFGVELSQQVAAPGYHTLKLGGDCPSNEARVLTVGAAATAPAPARR